MVDKGHKGADVDGVHTLRSGQRRGVTRTLKAMINRYSVIESTIGRMKMGGRLDRNPLFGALGDAVHAVMCSTGYNRRMRLSLLRLFATEINILLLPLLHELVCDRHDALTSTPA